METYICIIFDRKGKRLGTIEFYKRKTIPGNAEINNAINETFKNAYKYQIQILEG